MFQVSGHSVMQGLLTAIIQPNIQVKQSTFHFSALIVRRTRFHAISMSHAEFTEL